MSYINDALKKAQQERDGRYGHFGGIIASVPDEARRPRRLIVPGLAVALALLVSVAVLAVFFAVRQPLSVEKGVPAPVVAGPSTAPEAVPVESAAAGAVSASEKAPAGETPAGEEKQRAAASAETPKAEIENGEKPAMSAAAKQPAASSGSPQARREAAGRFKEALLAQRKGALRGAEDLYLKVLALDPGHVRALNNLGVLSLAQKKREKAIVYLGKAIALKKDYVDPYYNLACLYARDNEIEESLRYLKLAAAVDGNVKKWAEKDEDMKNVVASPAYKKIMEGQEN